MKKKEGLIAVYSRKSKFTGKGESIENQVELCRQYISGHYGAEAAENAAVYEDEGFSGGNLRRPGFVRMMAAARAHRLRAVVVYRLDRISRSIGDFAGLIDELGALGVDFISIREQFDTASPMGRAMMYIASVFSQLERETIAERIRDNMHELAKTGRWLGGTTPTGYDSESVETVSVNGKMRKSCRLRLIDGQADTVRTVFSIYGGCGSLALTESELLRRGLKTKTGRDFSRFSIKAMLQNPVYMISDSCAYDYFVRERAELYSALEEFDGVRGIMAYNRTRQEKGRSTVYRPVSEWIVCVGGHPGIIPAREWIAVQESLKRAGSREYGKPRGNEALLTGLLRCRCGSKMYPKLYKRTDENGGAVYTYVCKLKERSHGGLCSVRNVGGRALDTGVLAEIKALTEEAGRFTQELRARRGECAQGDGFIKRLSALNREKAETDRKIAALIDSLAELGEGEAREHVAGRIELLSGDRRKIQESISRIEAMGTPRSMGEEELAATVGLLSDFVRCIETTGLEQKRGAVRSLVERVVWDGESAEVFFACTDEDRGGAKTPLGEYSK